MKFQTVSDIYAENDLVRERLIRAVGVLSDEQATTKTENGKWTIQGIVEHLHKVEVSMTAISERLLAKAEVEGRTSRGEASLSDGFLEGISKIEDRKLEAPEVVNPSGKQTITESLSLMQKSRADLNVIRSKFESLDGTKFTFPHPYFGQMTAQDWLALIGGHEARHIRQIEKILSN